MVHQVKVPIRLPQLSVSWTGRKDFDNVGAVVRPFAWAAALDGKTQANVRQSLEDYVEDHV